MKRRKAQNAERTPYNIAAILQLGLIVFDFVMDILFASKKAPEVTNLFIPNTIILILSLTINFILALYIITNEKSLNQDFAKWSNSHKTVISIFALISSADIEALNILQSFGFFKSDFSEQTTGKIFWGACLDIFIEDIPQLIIQILYFRSVLYYDVISLLTLASSSLTLTVHIIGRFYQTIRPPRPKSTSTTSKHPLQIHKREIQSSDQGKESSKGKLPEVVVDTQKADDNKELLKNRSSISSFKEVLP
ncbi:unnamed protein product [Rhizophagus irregularis]|uniref:Uncharacterized protein n=1 Tax=Rhizophagus irregularis TaxID=588596 RepID=A0A2I1FT51_9GLOM|nr:hypothetical protein RhiirA4_390599 [Rhizophagus irregularis]CAB4428513.1 unnamed protein product [Rhizophagus irregularis]